MEWAVCAKAVHLLNGPPVGMPAALVPDIPAREAAAALKAREA